MIYRSAVKIRRIKSFFRFYWFKKKKKFYFPIALQAVIRFREIIFSQ